MNPPAFGVTVILPQGSHPKKVKRRRIKETFQRRQQARQWCRNHWHTLDHAGMEITHPERPPEPFKWNGVL